MIVELLITALATASNVESPEELRARLHEESKADHVALDYRELWDALAYTDQDLQNPENVTLCYTGWSRSAGDHGGKADQWNREHVWPQSRGLEGDAKSDLHIIRPTDCSVNSARGNLYFDDGGKEYVDKDGSTNCNRDHDSWEPRDAVKGDVARMLFYAAIRYEGESEPDLELVDELPTDFRTPYMGSLKTLLVWHEQDPVDESERRRNDRVEELQGNRNPFIDEPGFAQRIFEN